MRTPGTAFYDHMGARRAMEHDGRGPEESQHFTAGRQVLTHYATSLVRFGRVFLGLGQVVLAGALVRGGLVPSWPAWVGGALGVATIAVIIPRPDERECDRPILRANALWMLAVGIVFLRAGAGG